MTVFYMTRAEVQTKLRSTAAREGSGTRVGFTVGRTLGGAVERNRMKRRLREAVRLTPPPGANVDIVINPKKSLLVTEFSTLLSEVARAFDVIEQRLAGKAGSRPPVQS
jgi:ribonuclease P protein component